MKIKSYSGIISYDNYLFNLGEKLKDSNGKVFINHNGDYYTGFYIQAFVRMDFPQNQNSSSYYVANIILNSDIRNVMVKFYDKNDALFVNELLKDIQKKNLQSLNTIDYKISLSSTISINQIAASYEYLKDFYTAWDSKNFMKSDITSADIIGDSNTSVLNTIGGAFLGGGLGMIASKINPNTRYILNLSIKQHGVLSISCKNLSLATSIFKALGCERFIESQSKIIENMNPTLKDKLKEIDELKNEGIITEEEYKIKRKQIIEKY